MILELDHNIGKESGLSVDTLHKIKNIMLN